MQILLEIFAVAVGAVLMAKLVAPPTRNRVLGGLKAWVTLRAFWLILTHPVSMPEGGQEVALRLVLDTLQQVDGGTFWTFAALAAGIHFVGLLASMYRWILFLGGQGIELPFRHIFGSF